MCCSDETVVSEWTLKVASHRRNLTSNRDGTKNIAVETILVC